MTPEQQLEMARDMARATAAIKQLSSQLLLAKEALELVSKGYDANAARSVEKALGQIK